MDFQRQIGERVAYARKELGLNQEALSEMLGFNDRQTLSSIESGNRKVSSNELLRLIECLGKDLDFFTDPYRVLEPDAVSWRATGEQEPLADFETFALGLVGMDRQLKKQLKENGSPLRFYLPLDKKNSFEEAWEAAEALGIDWGLGECPAERLKDEIESRLKANVLFVDAPDGVSGGAVHLKDGANIFVNRRHGRVRRNFTLAHELFHILTWETMPPEKMDLEENRKTRVERLANNFAAALLMPQAVLEKAVEGVIEKLDNEDPAPLLEEWAIQTADQLQVSMEALMYRVLNLQLLPKELMVHWPKDKLESNELEDLYGKGFLDRVNRGIDRGFISARKAASTLRMEPETLADLMREYQLEAEF